MLSGRERREEQGQGAFHVIKGLGLSDDELAGRDVALLIADSNNIGTANEVEVEGDGLSDSAAGLELTTEEVVDRDDRLLPSAVEVDMELSAGGSGVRIDTEGDIVLVDSVGGGGEADGIGADPDAEGRVGRNLDIEAAGEFLIFVALAFGVDVAKTLGAEIVVAVPAVG